MEKSKKYNIYRTIMIIALTAFITFMVTGLVGYNYVTKGEGAKLLIRDVSSEQDLIAQLEKYKSIVDEYYLGEVNEEDLKEGAIKGYIEGLGDPYTEYISKEDMEGYMQDTLGNYVGIGIYMILDKEDGKIKVVAPMQGSPAEAAGIKAGDMIETINGESYTLEEMEEASEKIKGEEGTTVKLGIIRGTEELEIEVKRENIKVNPVNGEVIENNIGYIQFSSFDKTTAEDFKAKYEELKSKGINSLIIDLRNNGGGLVEQATKIADYFTEKDVPLLYEVDKNGNEEEVKSEDGVLIDIPTIILTNENTASASEILAGALKDLDKATIVGTKTYGKGVIQEIFTLRDGSGIKLTTEEYQTPNHNKINKVGIEPDEKVELPETVTNILNVPEDQDTQLQKAIEILKQK